MSEDDPTHKGFAQVAFSFGEAERAFEAALDDAGVEYDRLGWDWYDNSLEIYGVAPEARLSEAAQRVIHEGGFSRVFVNHTDKWETHYSWAAKAFEPKPGWRVKYGHKADPKTSHIYVERFPDGWPKDWLESGYVRVIGESVGTTPPPADTGDRDE